MKSENTLRVLGLLVAIAVVLGVVGGIYSEHCRRQAEELMSNAIATVARGEKPDEVRFSGCSSLKPLIEGYRIVEHEGISLSRRDWAFMLRASDGLDYRVEIYARDPWLLNCIPLP